MKNILITTLSILVLILIAALLGFVKIDLPGLNQGARNHTDDAGQTEQRKEAQAHAGETSSASSMQDEAEQLSDDDKKEEQESSSAQVNTKINFAGNFSLQAPSEGAPADSQEQSGSESASENPSSVFGTGDFACLPPITEIYPLRGYSYDYTWTGRQEVKVSVETVYAPEIYKTWQRCRKDPRAWFDNKFARVLKVSNKEKGKTIRLGLARGSGRKEYKIPITEFFYIYNKDGTQTEPYLYPGKSVYLIPKEELSINTNTDEDPYKLKFFLRDDYIQSKGIKLSFPENRTAGRILYVDSYLPCKIGAGSTGTWHYKYQISTWPSADGYKDKLKMLSKQCKR